MLLGAFVVSDDLEGRTAGRIVETEAYLPGDAAAHSYAGQTLRNRTLFMRRGHAYVYFIYGSAYCLNVSSETVGVGAGVLLRAAEPVVGIDLMQSRRPRSVARDLCRGPGRLAAALGVTRADDGLDLCASRRLWLAAPASGMPRSGENARAGESARIGLTKEADRLLRFYERGSPFLSGTRKLNA
ncbi:MAG: DNA-3-methyladenine glycosylase [Candidatus Eremiobacteraeota bacterium]|nr:DNA-3-methyladenine glycosylase [Candidatus Eremiobacteraeota bacterium]